MSNQTEIGLRVMSEKLVRVNQLKAVAEMPTHIPAIGSIIDKVNYEAFDAYYYATREVDLTEGVEIKVDHDAVLMGTKLLEQHGYPQFIKT